MLSKATIGRARGEERNEEPNISTVKVGVKFVFRTGTPGDYAAKVGKISELYKQMAKDL